MLPLGTFYNNTAHSTIIGVNLWIAGKRSLCSMEDQVFNQTTLWRNSQGLFVGEIRYDTRHIPLNYLSTSSLTCLTLFSFALFGGIVSSAVRFVGSKFLENEVSDLSLYMIGCEAVSKGLYVRLVPCPILLLHLPFTALLCTTLPCAAIFPKRNSF